MGDERVFWGVEFDRLKSQLQESERLRQEAFASCETMRQELAKVTQELNAVTQERDEWKAAVEYQQQQATQLRLQVAALEASVDQEQGVSKKLIEELAELQTQLDAATVTPAQQSDNAAERLEKVRQMIAHVLGWYTCTDWFDEVERAEAWEQVGELLGRLQREAG